jgi:hypothetical protein
MKQINPRKIWLSSLLLFVCIVPLRAQHAARAECFPFEKMPADQRGRAEELLLKTLDGEGLYTIVGNIKPMSSGFQTFQVTARLPRFEAAEGERIVQQLAAKKPEELTNDEKAKLGQAKQAIERRQTLDKIADARQILERWRCGDELYADVQHYARPFDGRRFFDAVVFSRPRLRQMLTEKAAFFSRWGISANSHPLEVLYAMEYDETGAREGGYGYLFGYPDYAVRFFVESSNEEKFTGHFVERDFRSIPTFARETNAFVYAVPKGQAENEIDKALRARAETIFADYRRRRAQYIGEGKRGVVEMLRDWFCNSPEGCSPSKAKID